MPEKHPGNFIGSSLHIKHHPYTLTLSGISPSKLQYNRGRKIGVPQIGKAVVLSDINHTSQIFNQAPVGIISSSLVEKTPAVRIGVKHDLHGVNHCGFAASGMAGKKINSFMEG